MCGAFGGGPGVLVGEDRGHEIWVQKFETASVERNDVVSRLSLSWFGRVEEAIGKQEYSLNMWVKRTLNVDFLAALVATAQQFEVVCDTPPLLVVHFSGALVADPGVSASSTRVDPQDVLEAKVLPQCCVDHLDGHCDKGPAFVADVCALTARSDVVVIRHIDIKDQLFGDRAECTGFAQRLPVTRVGRVDGADFETDGRHLHALLAELVGREEGLVSDVCVVGQDKGKLAVHPVRRRGRRVIEPLEEVAEWE